jgi:hypothetical protein
MRIPPGHRPEGFVIPLNRAHRTLDARSLDRATYFPIANEAKPRRRFVGSVGGSLATERIGRIEGRIGNILVGPVTEEALLGRRRSAATPLAECIEGQGEGGHADGHH